MKPVMLLDIDGVVNAIPQPGELPTYVWPEDEWIDTEATASHGKTYRIVAAKPVLKFLRNLHESDAVEIRWHTTWQESASAVAKVLDLPGWPVHAAPEFDETAWRRGWSWPGGWWKTPAALRVAEEEKRPLIWIDDDLDYGLSIVDRFRLDSALLVCPATREGLIQVHLDKISSFVDALESLPQLVVAA